MPVGHQPAAARTSAFQSAESSRAESQRGFTLMEMMMVIAILALMAGALGLGGQALLKSKLRSGARRVSATMRMAFNRAMINGWTVRLAIDFEKGKLWLEKSEERVSLARGRTQNITTDAKEAEAAQARKLEDGPQRGMPLNLFGGGGEEDGELDDDGSLGIDTEALLKAHERDLQPVKRARSLFQPLKAVGVKPVVLSGGVIVERVMTPRYEEPTEDGIAYLYFFPQGHAEPAVIHLRDRSEAYYSVVMHPLSGQAKVYSCKYRIDRSLGEDDERRHTGDPCED